MSPLLPKNKDLPIKKLLVASVLSLGFNLLIVAGLAYASSVSSAPQTPVIPITTISVIPAPPPAEITPEEQTPKENPEPPMALELPSLELSHQPDTSSALTLPSSSLEGESWTLALPSPKWNQGTALDSAPRWDTPPRLLFAPNMARFYPRMAKRRGIKGKTILRINVGQGGDVEAIRILESVPVGVFDQAAKRLATTLKYEPGTRKGKAAKGVTELELAWNVDGDF
ncbi:MAG: TonB family protein [Myxococcota bacterium]|nr:TonB family protein [Myxococcota bacterium]